VRGEILLRLRDAAGVVALDRLADAGPDRGQVMRCLDSLVVDGLVEPLEDDRYRLPA
jgi:A/G-specific adenine glycosylase